MDTIRYGIRWHADAKPAGGVPGTVTELTEETARWVASKGRGTLVMGDGLVWTDVQPRLVYWTAEDAYGDMCLWSGKRIGDPDCDVVLVQRGTPTVVWDTCLAQLVTADDEAKGA